MKTLNKDRAQTTEEYIEELKECPDQKPGLRDQSL